MELHNFYEPDYPAIARIYETGIATGNATFQSEAPGWADWNSSHLAACRIAAFEAGEMLGWAALTAVSGRCIYAGVAEVSIYVDPVQQGKGIGKKLLEQLISASEAAGFWTLQAGIFPENIASIKLHESCGFRIIGSREKIGQMNGCWRDNLILERRSKSVGV